MKRYALEKLVESFAFVHIHLQSFAFIRNRSYDLNIFVVGVKFGVYYHSAVDC
jgi:hypothetical protein